MKNKFKPLSRRQKKLLKPFIDLMVELIIGGEMCSKPTLHNFKNDKPKTKCKWCKRTVESVNLEIQKMFVPIAS